MDTSTKENLKRMIGATIVHPILGTFILSGINCDYIYAHRPGEESRWKLSPEDFSITKFPDTENTKNNFISALESDTGLRFIDVKNTAKIRKGELKDFRLFHMFFLKRVMDYSLADAGEVYKKDHATVLHAVKNICNWYHTNRKFRETYEHSIKYILDLRPHAFDYKK